MKLRKGATIGNVTTLIKSKTWWESMSYSELLAERRFLRAEIKRIKRARAIALLVDPRCIWMPETNGIDKTFKEMAEACKYVIEFYCEKEMIKRMNLTAASPQGDQHGK